MLVIDGAYGEGGGQILRTTLSLAALLTQPVRFENIRAGRKNPGLAAQHLTAVRAAASICKADLSGDRFGSAQLTFVPQSAPVPGCYQFDVADAREGGSAGAATLVLQTILLPLAVANGPSEVTIKGGTHVPWSPSFHYIRDVYLPTLANMGVSATATLTAWGWYPAGNGEIKAVIPGQAHITANCRELGSERGQLKKISGVAVASSLPAHIAQRIRNRAVNLFEQHGLPATIEPQRVRSVSPGAGIFLVAEYESGRAGFTALGKKGKPSEQVAEEAVNALLAFHRSGTALDEHLTDQLILPMALSKQPALLAAQRLSTHTLTNINVVQQFLGPVVTVDEASQQIRFNAKNR
ncbi:MAG: RNA 3'-phosphate cyclase [Anaerolineae bacterium]|nr:RNA 3'-phosphate cyclase [Anaerolineae bacterium]